MLYLSGDKDKKIKIPKTEEKNITEALDEIIDSIKNTEFHIQDFLTYHKLLKEVYFSSFKLHKTSRKCAIPGCTNRSIKKSHSIPKSSVLDNITTDHHLLKPEISMSSHNLCMTMERVGINNASVFPGYCSSHEKIFKDFESDGVIDNEEKAFLQMYRSICRERVFREIEMEINRKMQEAYLSKLQEEAKQLLLKKILITDHKSKIHKLEKKGGDFPLQFLDHFNKYITSLIMPLKDVEKSIYNCLNGGDKTNFLYIVTTIDFKIPISLCGYATIDYQVEGDKEKNAYIFLNVLPLQSSTTIICLAEKKYQHIFDAYTKFAFSDVANLLSMIESFMINGSDHWFISPAYWQNIPINKQKRILFDILNSEKSFLDQYPISIFDDIRENLLDVFIKNTSDRELSIAENLFIKREKAKLSMASFPIEENEEKLINRLMSKI